MRSVLVKLKTEEDFEINESVLGRWSGGFVDDIRDECEVLDAYKTDDGLEMIVTGGENTVERLSLIRALIGRASSEKAYAAGTITIKDIQHEDN